ncbi:uncharacterized protein A4U43_C07F19260 [Asparagus officinalis]|uniref:Uncharacterized protein n=1 Tax=Asparagus officinalis TaxID=4686 RepID=A0A5P1ED64_ASPOF|nr:uncharacterized protein A4U43_C07F19260 [Asparagus officinalis]
MSVPQFLVLLELYNPDANTFLTKHGELGLALHDMHKISGIDPLSKKSRPQISLKKFADYLFKNTDSVLDEPICELSPLTVSEVNKLIKRSNAQSYTTAGIEDGFVAGTKFQTFLWDGVKPIGPTTLLAGGSACSPEKLMSSYGNDRGYLQRATSGCKRISSRELAAYPNSSHQGGAPLYLLNGLASTSSIRYDVGADLGGSLPSLSSNNRKLQVEGTRFRGC